MRYGDRQMPKMREWCKMVRDTGVLVCVNGQIPEMFMEMESQGCIKSTGGIVCAMWNKYEDQYAINKEYVVKYGGSSIRAS